MSESESEIGIDELARRCDTTVRTIREYQTLGVLPPPRKHGRTAVYDDGHVSRLRAISRLQQRGYSLAGIADLLEAWETGSTLPAVLGVADVPVIGAIDEPGVIVSADQLEAELAPVFATPSLARRAVQVGLVRPLDDDRYTVRSPALVQLAADLLDADVSAAAVLEVVAAITGHAGSLAEATVDFLLDHVIDRHGDAGPTDDDIHLLQRGRTLLAQAMATSLMEQIGSVFAERAENRPELTTLINAVRVGQVRDASR